MVTPGTPGSELSPPPPEATPSDRSAPIPAASSRATAARIVRSYRSPAVRLYCLARIRIIRTRFLEEMAQYLPREGRVMEVGCGFGLFGLYFASLHPEVEFRAVDLDAARIDLAETSRAALGLPNIRFEVGDARAIALTEELDAVYLLDILHHIPPEAARSLLHDIHERLRPGGVLLIKDIDTRPRYKMAFTWLLDVLMTRGERPDYWSAEDMSGLLHGLGFRVARHAMVDSLPYSHMLYVARKPPAP